MARHCRGDYCAAAPWLLTRFWPYLGCGAGQVRARVLKDQLADDFHRWYPGLSQAPDPMTLAA